ncbi:MAG: hypothetical protein Q9160_001489 [Pyrenula sp. 1 TL-2023]
MKTTHLLSLIASACFAAGRSLRHVGLEDPVDSRPRRALPNRGYTSHGTHLHKRASSYLTNATADFAVDGAAIPDVDFDIGESYAGLLPISDNANETSQLYFWFFPSPNTAAENEILIWLNGGPGCSSLEGLLQENGESFLMAGTPTATNEEEAAAQFLGFFKNFVETFSMQGYTVYVAGESYAGYYVPYIADAMLNASGNSSTNSTSSLAPYTLDSIMIYDPSLTYGVLQSNMVAVPFVDYHANLFTFNDTFTSYLHTQADSCGYTDYLSTYLTFPPPQAPFPTPPNANGRTAGCNLRRDIQSAVTLLNPCWDIYQVATTCPLLWDVLGFPGSFDYTPPGFDTLYFDRADVKSAINAPDTPWAECSDGVLDEDDSLPSTLSVLPGVIERTQRTIIGHGLLDMILIANGSLLAIQNMTWNGGQGFSQAPTDEFFVPYHAPGPDPTLAGAGVMGHYRTERGLTYVDIGLSGHMVPQYAPSAAYRQLEFLLGRIDSLGDTGAFTTPPT